MDVKNSKGEFLWHVSIEWDRLPFDLFLWSVREPSEEAIKNAYLGSMFGVTEGDEEQIEEAEEYVEQVEVYKVYTD